MLLSKHLLAEKLLVPAQLLAEQLLVPDHCEQLLVPEQLLFIARAAISAREAVITGT
jgi:hypothetical protein